MRKLAAPILGLAVLLGLGACLTKITEDTPNQVSVRYDGVSQSLDDATAIANKSCSLYGKVAKLREVYTKAILDHVAHFNCTGG
jgi:hypothetical protein